MERKYQISDKNLLTIFTQDQLTEIASDFSKELYYNIINSTLQESVIKQFNDDIYSQQILISLLAFCYLKEKKSFIAKNLFISFPYDHKNAIFSYLFLKAKVFITNGNSSAGLAIYNELAKRYNKDDDNEDEITKLEAESQFSFFGYFFDYLYEINNKKSKHIKAILDLTTEIINLGFYDEGYKILGSLYKKYPNDLKVQFEYAKKSIITANIAEYDNIMQSMYFNQNDIKEQNSQLNKAYDMNIAYLDRMKKSSHSYSNESNVHLKEILSNDSIFFNNL